jgi:Bacterial Ig-like domain
VQFKKYLWILIYGLFCACATVMAPTGGPLDKTAPKLAEQSSKDSSLNFKGGQLVFEFDEKIDPAKIKLETFPLMKNAPKVTVDKRSLTIQIPDSLLEENTTYKLSFGNTIKDIYEGTALGNLDFTFSTGNVLDTLQLNGIVLQANSGLADTQAYVLLYSKIEGDSDVQYKRPLYATKVDQYGGFKISNLPEKEFYIYAVADKNMNYVYDILGERIAFLSTTVIPMAQQNVGIQLLSFAESSDTNKSALLSSGRNKPATTSVPQRIKLNIDTTDSKKRTFDITQPITLSFSNILTQFDASKIRLYCDAILDETGIVSYDSNKKTVTINIDLIQDTIYKLQLMEGFAQDTVAFKEKTFTFRTKKAADYGSLVVSIPENKKTTGKQILSLFQNNILISSQTVMDTLVNFNLLNPGNYTMNLLYDANNNGVWDSGLYKIGKRQPEKVEAFNKEILLKANWINKLTWGTSETLAKEPNSPVKNVIQNSKN